MNAISLETKKVADLSGSFFIPAYQRGYRWTDEVTKLIEDILEFEKTDPSSESKYCLQPIVVKKRGEDSYELIDGQQRLTTIYLIYKVIREYFPKSKINFSLTYEIRSRDKEYLENLSSNSSEDNIDYFYIKGAFTRIHDWFSKQSNSSLQAINLFRLLSERVEIIWYEVDENEDENALFQRLNIGKIPLTSSELVKAIFLSEASKKSLSGGYQEEIAMQWDSIEKELHDSSLWGFLTNSRGYEYQTRIDLILDLNSGKTSNSYEKYGTFFYFDRLRKEGKDLKEIWQEILHTFLILKDWYKNHEFYHKIGYLIAVNKSLSEIFELAKNKTKKELSKSLDNEIKKVINSDKNYADMSYENASDYKKISNLLLLFNVESTRNNGAHSMWFPFDKYKEGKWSLEHIHAQHSDGMKTIGQWKEWLSLHLESIKTVGELQVSNKRVDRETLDPIIKKMEEMSQDSYPKEHFGEEFEKIKQDVEKILSDGSTGGYLHTISNLALLNMGDNAALSNSTFDVKRNKIIEMDKKGVFIPYCTKMVFLKYYTNSAENQLHFWGQEDRKSYVKSINEALKDFLEPKITIIKED